MARDEFFAGSDPFQTNLNKAKVWPTWHANLWLNAVHRSLLSPVFVALATGGWLLCQPASAAFTTTTRVSVDSAAAEGIGESFLYSDGVISAGGRFVTFYSNVSNLVEGDTNGTMDVFVRDRQNKTTERVSIDNDGVQGISQSGGPSISADGRFVAFESYASNLVEGDTNGVSDILVRDRESGLTERVSVASDSAQANDSSVSESISSTGRFVVFVSAATNLSEGEDNRAADIFVHDRQSGTTECISMGSGGEPANDASTYPSITADGRFVTYSSNASNLVVGDLNESNDVFVYDRQTKITERVSVDSTGAEGSGAGPASRLPDKSSISEDGRYVAFTSYTTNLVAGDTNGVGDVFFRDRQNGTTERLSRGANGAQGNALSSEPSISADGRYVVFESYASNLASGDTNGLLDVFVRDLQTATTSRISVGDGGTQGNGISFEASLSPDGQFVAFQSEASNLVPGDLNGKTDVFVRGPAERVVAVSASPSQSGVVAGAGTFFDGNLRTVAATSSAAYRFVNWTEGGIPVNTDPSYTFTVSADRTLVANFELVTDIISLSSSPVSSGTVSGGGEFVHNTERTVTATPSAHFRFVNWTEGGSPVSTSASYTFTLDADRTLVANFKITHSIAVSASPIAGGTASGGGTFVEGSSRTVVATPNTGYSFLFWTQAGVQVSANLNYAFTLSTDRTLVANFARTSFTIFVSALPVAGGTVSGGGTFGPGSSRIVVATPTTGYNFLFWTQGGVQVSTSAKYTFTLNSNRVLVANFRDPRRRNDLLVDFGLHGLWRFLNNGTWQQLITSSPVAISAGDLDGNPKDEAIASFAELGLFARYNNSASWIKIHNVAPARMAVGDLDGNGKDDLVVDLGAQGIWVLRNNTAPFVRLHASASQGLAIGDLDGSGKDEVLADFSTGLWVSYNGSTTWVRLYPTSPVRMVTGDLDGNRKDEVIIDLGGGGLWARYNNSGGWVKLYASTSQGLATGDLDGDGKDELIADFGSAGLWARFQNATWKRLDARNPIALLAADLDRNGKAELVADFGAVGLFAFYNNSLWRKLRGWSSQAMVAGGFD